MSTTSLNTAVRRKPVSLKLRAVRWHGWLGWAGGLACVAWGLSGLLHIAMVEFGAQQAVFRPPVQALSQEGARPLRDIAAAAGIAHAHTVKLVATPLGPAWQVTTHENGPRRYLDPLSGAELPLADRTQAIWLARHYLTRPEAPLAAVTLIEDFTAEYPAVNRLLPVWRVEFTGPDRLTAYVHTETAALGAVTDATKRFFQGGFQIVHTWNWLPREAEWARVLLMTLLVGALAGLSATGIALLITIRRQVRAPGARGWHRMAGFVLALPLFGFSASGLYHLLFHAGDEGGRILSLAPPMDLTRLAHDPAADWPAIAAALAEDGVSLQALSLIEAPDGTLLYRLGLAGDLEVTGGRALRSARFNGVQPTGPALYLDAGTGRVWEGDDALLARDLATRATGRPAPAIEAAELVTRFGPGYDFRNKRLPVWRVAYAEEAVFVDTATGALVDRQSQAAKTEAMVFNLVHKWDFLRPLPRELRQAITTAVVLASVIMMGGIGLNLAWKRQTRRRKPARPAVQGRPKPA